MALINKMVVELSKDFQTQYNKLIFPKLQYRNSRTGARSTRTQIDHDVFEGLPVRHWRKRSFNINAAPEKDILNPLGTGDTGWPELPMPRDAHMYTPMSEALLRAARMGQVKKAATPLMDDDKEPGEDDDVDGDLDMGFVAKRWAVVPKDMEGPEPEFLAKRRKGLPSIYTGATGPLGNTAQMRKTKIRKLDTEGNSYIWEVLVPEGQAVDGEIVEEETSPTQAPAPGTVVEGLGVVNAEGVVIAGDQVMPTVNRRRPPPPKRKAKGPGRGRKKKVAFTPGTEGAATADGISAAVNGSIAGVDESNSAKTAHGILDGDTEMGDENVLQEGEEGSEEGSEGEEGEDGEREEGELSPSPTPAKSPAEPAEPPAIVVNDIKVEAAAIARDTTPSPSKIPVSSPVEPPREYSTDPMLLDEDDDEPMGHSFLESTTTTIPQNIESMAVVAEPVAAEISEETILNPDSIPRPSEAIVEEHYAAPIPEQQAGAQVILMTTSPSDKTLQPLSESVKQSVTDQTPESLAEQPTENPAELSTRPWAEPMSGDPAENGPEAIVVSTAGAISEQTPGAPADHPEEAVPEHTSNIMSTPATEAMIKPKGGPETEFPVEPPTGSVPDFEEEFEPVAVQSTAKQSMTEQSMTEHPMTEQSMTEQPMTEHSILEKSVTEQSITEQPRTEQSMTEQTMTEQSLVEQPITEELVSEQSITEQPLIEQHLTEQPLTEQPTTKQPTTEPPTPEPSVPEQSVPEQSVTEQPMTEQPMTEPWARPATEPFPEAISPERRFSYTRVTTSPKAPTPSPPTPIESTFGLKAPYLSPKAPTMSPPTPIERSMSSSPDIPLADQHFRLPPQIDAAQEEDQALALDLPHIAGADPMSLETASNTDTRFNAQLLVEPNSLDEAVEPRVAEESEGSTQHFTDGEEDLLGSLERSLGKHGGGS